MNNKCSDPNIKGGLYVRKDSKPYVNISFEEDNTCQRLQECVQNIAYEINSNWCEDCQSIIDAILQEIEKVVDIL